MFVRAALFSSLLVASDSSVVVQLASRAAETTVASIPARKTPAEQLESNTLRHFEVLRVPRDFGEQRRDIVLDAWVPREGPAKVADVRLWWLEGSERDTRKPFGRKTLRFVDVDYAAKSDGSWEVTFGGMGKVFPLQVALDERERPVVYANVNTEDGKVDRCRILRGKLFARRVLNKPVGLDRLEVRCRDADGRVRVGTLRARGR